MPVFLYAQPYTPDAEGFSFRTLAEYREKEANCIDRFGQRVEEFEIEFLDGECIDTALASAVSINQANLPFFFEGLDDWDDYEKQILIIGLSEGGCPFTTDTSPDDFDVDLYHAESLRDLAEQFVDEGLFGEVPPQFQFYIDYDAIARDLSFDYTEIEIAGERLIYRIS